MAATTTTTIETVVTPTSPFTTEKTIARLFKGFKICSVTGCWIWVKSCNEKGYGQFWCNDKNMKPHRVSYLIFRGEIEEGMELHHKCETECCVNPWHTTQVTTEVNTQYKWESIRAAQAAMKVRG